jgi:hypothetical protein
LPISSIGHWFFGSLVFWAACIFWLSTPCWTYSSQRFFSHSVDDFLIFTWYIYIYIYDRKFVKNDYSNWNYGIFLFCFLVGHCHRYFLWQQSRKIFSIKQWVFVDRGRKVRENDYKIIWRIVSSAWIWVVTLLIQINEITETLLNNYKQSNFVKSVLGSD